MVFFPAGAGSDFSSATTFFAHSRSAGDTSSGPASARGTRKTPSSASVMPTFRRIQVMRFPLCL